MTNNEKRRFIYIAIMLVLLIIFIVSSLTIKKIVDDSKSTKYNLIYKNTSNVDYNLSIRENEFIKPEYIKDYEVYISSLVKEIDMTMTYKYEGSSSLPIGKKSRVVATIYGQYNLSPTEKIDNPIMWKKEYVIKENKYEEPTDLYDFEIKENFKLNYEDFNKEVIRFKEKFSLPTIAYLDVTLEVEFGGYSDQYSLKEKQVVSAKIPLNEQIFSVDTVKNYTEDKSILSNETTAIRSSNRKLFIHIALVILSAFSIVVTFKMILSTKEERLFHEEVLAIKKSYDEIIVETKNIFNIKGLNLIKIINFDEMLNLADSLVVPIMLYEESTKATFYIIKGEMFYYFVMENNKKKK